MTDTGTPHLSDYLAILRRRKWQALIPMVLILLGAIVLALVLPPVYRSSATILIEEELVPENVVASTATGYADRRIELITKRLMTYDNLAQIVERLNLYPQERALKGEGGIVARLRKGISVETTGAQVTNGDFRGGKSSSATLAFTVSFDADSPQVAQKVTNELVDLYMEENIKIRTTKAATTRDFLVAEEKRTAKKVAELEAKLAAYKEQNFGRLPELMNLNMQLMQRTEKELEDAEAQIYNLEERKTSLQGELAQVEPYTGQSPAAHLRELQSQYLTASANYAPNHPDVVRLRKQIALLKKEMGGIDGRDAIGKQLNETRTQLEIARRKYANDHPDVIRLERSVRELKRAFKDAENSTQLGLALKPDNPAYISIQTQLNTIELQLKAARELRARAKAKLTEYEQRLTETPRAEQTGLALNRAYQEAVKEHQAMKAKLAQADLAVELESEQRGQRYSLLEPPYFSDTPVKPNRLAILLLGMVLSLGGGVGFASLAEYMDRTVRGAKGVSALLGAPPLAVIPHIDVKKVPYREPRRA